jgi:hypothetical protein
VANPAGDALSAEEIAQALREIAGEAAGEDSYIEDYVDATCKDCGSRQKFVARMKVKGRRADPATRFNALKMIVEHGYGKPGTSKDDIKVDLDINVATLSPDNRGNVRRHVLALLRNSKDPNVQALLKLAKATNAKP